MIKPYYKLGVGPMSREVIEAVYSYSHTKNAPLMLIASKSQVDYASGYVLQTKEFVHLCKQFKKHYPDADVLICRDHCGPGFNKNPHLSDVYKTIDTDVENGFDLIHIDFCHLNEGNILLSSKDVIEYTLAKNPKIKIEIGTESNGSKDFLNFEKVEKEMAFFTSFFQPDFFVCQTGSLTREVNQVGKFNKKYVAELTKLAKKYHLTIKEHNADYLSADDIRQRSDLVGAMNIAPQLGVLQTAFTLEKAKLYGINSESFLEKSYQSKHWGKWLYTNTAENKFLCSLIAGHYCFNSEEYKKIVKEISKQENFYASFEKEVHKLIDLYVNNFTPAK